MPRSARLDAPGALHHIIARGIEQKKIFEKDEEKKLFLDKVERVLLESDASCFAWAVMNNHFHLLLRTGFTPLSRIMSRVMTSYAVNYNLRNKRSGHLFQNRYKSIICEEEAYLLQLIRYIHNNPVRAKIVVSMDELDHYPYTGHAAIVGNMKCTFLRTDEILAYFSKGRRKALKLYKEFVLNSWHEKKRKELTGGGLIRSLKGRGINPEVTQNREACDERILGSGEFVETILKEAKLKEACQPAKNRISLEELINKVCSYTKIDSEELLSDGRLRHISNTRAIICYLGIRYLGYSASSLSRSLKIRHSSVLSAAERGKQFVLEGGLEEKILGE
jgi:REP element-mobilizing transposase RayT